MNRRRALTYAGVGALAAVAGGTLAWQRFAPGAAGDKAVNILFAQRLTGLDGTEQALSQWQGRPLVVNFWATWCAPCVDEMPELDALQAELKDSAQFIGIGIDSAANMKRFVEKVAVRYPLLVAGNVGTELARELGNTSGGLPFTVVIDEKGALIHQYAGRIHVDTLRSVVRGA